MAKFIILSRADYDRVVSRHESAAVVLNDLARTCDRGVRIRVRAFHDARRQHGDSLLPTCLLDELRAAEIGAAGTDAVAETANPVATGSVTAEPSNPSPATSVCAAPAVTGESRSKAEPRVSSIRAADQAVPDEVIKPRNAEAKSFAWVAAEAAVVGASHLRMVPPMPCQDAAIADGAARPLAVVADGAGSAPLSHLGASSVVAAVRRLVRTLDADFAAVLDSGEPTQEMGEALACRIVEHAAGTLEDLAMAHQRQADDFRCTLLAWVLGTNRSMWIKVGDGALIAHGEGGICCVGPTGKGEYANQTFFVGSRLSRDQWCWGGVSSPTVKGVAAMSDGAADRLVSADGGRVAPAMRKLLDAVAAGKADRRHVFDLLADGSIWKGSSGDDKSLALLVCEGTCSD